jgi:plasmid maintenance system antidote protein VapI
MSKRDFVATLKRLGYTPHNAHELLGIARSTVFRIVNGSSKVPAVVEKLLQMYELHGVPEAKK